MQIEILKEEAFAFFKGYLEEDIEYISYYYKDNLPKVLKEFLYLCGKNFFSISRGPQSSGLEFTKVLISEECNRILREETFLDLSLRYILCITDDNCWFINLFDGDNPPVYFYKKYPDKIEIVKIFNTITEMTEKQLESYYNHFGAENLKNVLNRFS